MEDTYVISLAKLFTNPSATTTTPQQNTRKGTVATPSSTISSRNKGRYLLHLDGPTRFNAKFLPDRGQESDKTLVMHRALRGNFEQSIWNLCKVNLTWCYHERKIRTSKITAQRFYLRPVKCRSLTNPAIFAFPKQRIRCRSL